MINLLPQDYKKMIKHARSNSRLLRYILYFVLIVFIAIAVIAYGMNLVLSTAPDIKEQISDREAVASELEDEHQSAIKLKSDLDLVSKIVDNQVRISVLMEELADILPPGVVLTNLNLSEDKTGPIKLDVKSVNENGVSTALVNISNSEMFKGAEIILVQSEESENPDNPSRPFTHIGGINAYLDDSFDFEEANNE